MKIFHCDHCDQLVFFENTRCLSCDQILAFLPDLSEIGSLQDAGDGLWSCANPQTQGKKYRLCDNYTRENVCNWAIDADDANPLCISCRLTRVLPDLSLPQNKQAWFLLEAAKRRLVYTLLQLKLPLANKTEDPIGGLTFEFLADPLDPSAPRVLTGHDNGLIVINIAEANDAEREKRRMEMGEPYRTLLGHFRHEVGHYYWDRLIANTDRLAAFRQRFGDEQQDYGLALQNHYQNGPPADWQSRFISTYATAHPWEDWAETWAHYLHMTDTLETAAACGLALKPRRRDEPTLKTDPQIVERGAFDRMIEAWYPLTYVLNNLNRGLGLQDGYPFVLLDEVVDKLRFVHETIVAKAPAPQPLRQRLSKMLGVLTSLMA